MNAKEIRNITGLSQTKFCKEYNIPLRTYQSWENGERKPAEYILSMLERLVKIDYDIKDQA